MATGESNDNFEVGKVFTDIDEVKAFILNYNS